MGCDIHIWAEVKNKETKEWEMVGEVFKGWNDTPTDQPYDGRNYDLFAILADVRNGRGFAGVKTGNGFNIIAEPKGVPEDASDVYKARCFDWGSDGHSHSYFTVAELLAFDWSQKTTHQGWVDFEEYQKFKKTGKPESWSGGISGFSVKHVTNAQMDEVTNDPKRNYFTLVSWVEPYAESVNSFLTKTIPALQRLGSNEEVRIVFFFDN